MIECTPKIRGYCADPLLTEAITMVSPLWRQIFASMEKFSDEIQTVFKSEEKLKPLGNKNALAHTKPMVKEISRARTTAPKKQSNAQFDTLVDTLDKIFDQRLDYLPAKIDLKPGLILSAVAKSIFKVQNVNKCLIEEIRSNFYTNNEYRQIQVDMAYIKLHFWEFVDEKVLVSLVDQALDSAENSSLEIPIPLDSLVPTI